MTSTMTAPLLRKLNHAGTARYLSGKSIEIDYPPFSQTDDEEKEVLRTILFTVLKRTFLGCKIRPNANSFSLRLDGHIHKKAAKLRKILRDEPEWQGWFQDNNSRIARRLQNTQSPYHNSNYYRHQEMPDGKSFLYFPFTPQQIYSYASQGLTPYLESIISAHKKDQQLAEVYEETIQLMETEIRRREEEAARLLREKRDQYNSHLFGRLYKSATELQESQDPLERLFAQKFIDWATENHTAPRYAADIGPVEIVAPGLEVRVMAPPGSEEEGWIVIPPFEGYPEIPADYEFQGWGSVTRVDMTSERSRGGQSPIVVEEHLFTELDMTYWSHLIPEDYHAVHEVTTRLRAEAQAEIEPFLAEERRREAERKRIENERAETLRIQDELLRQQTRERFEMEAARRATAAAASAELTQEQVQQAFDQSVDAMPSDTPPEEPVAANASLLEALRNQVGSQPAAARANSYGLYHNTQAIPIEQYVAIRQDGTVRRFANTQRALAWLGDSEMPIHNYYAPFAHVGHAASEDDGPF